MTPRLPDANAPNPIDDGDSSPRNEIHDDSTLKVNAAVAGAPTLRGEPVQSAPPEDEPRHFDLAIDAANRVTGRSIIDGSDPIVGRVVLDSIVAIKKLGAGGTGAVYLAVDTQEGLHDRKYALKVLAPSFATDERERFKREVSAAARIHSRRVVEVYRHGTFRDRRPWMLMEHVDGVSLEAELARQRVMSVEQALSRVALGLVRAVAEVHATKVIHRDLKPANVMIVGARADEQDVMLLDFSLARIGGGEAAIFRTNPNRAGGTPGYWAPESVAGQAIEYRTDVWGIGIMLFEMLSGELPFGRPKNSAEVNASITALMGEPAPKLNAVRRRHGLAPVSPKIEMLIDDCLCKEACARPELGELHKRLKKVIEEQAKRAGARNPLMTMRSAAQSLRPRAATPAGSREMSALRSLLGRYADRDSPSPRSSLKLGLVIMAVMVAIAIAAVIALSAPRH